MQAVDFKFRQVMPLRHWEHIWRHLVFPDAPLSSTIEEATPVPVELALSSQDPGTAPPNAVAPTEAPAREDPFKQVQGLLAQCIRIW